MYCTSWANTVCSLYQKGMELEKASWVLFALAQQHDLEERNGFGRIIIYLRLNARVLKMRNDAAVGWVSVQLSSEPDVWS